MKIAIKHGNGRSFRILIFLVGNSQGPITVHTHEIQMFPEKEKN